MPLRRPWAPSGVPPAPVILVAAALAAACGKRGDPLPPFRLNPEPITRLELVQRGDAYELAFVAPTRTIDGQQLPVLDVELLISSGIGILDELVEPIALQAEPGERITHTGLLPEPGTPLRFAVRSLADGKPSPLSPESLLVVKPPPPPPSDVSVRVTPEGLSLSWTECVPTTPEPVIAADGAPSETKEPPAAGMPAGAGRAGDGQGESSRSGIGVRRGPEERGDRRPGEPPPSAPDAVPETAPPPAPGAGEVEDTGSEGDGEADAEETEPAAPEPAPSTGVLLYRRSPAGEPAALVASPLATEGYLDTAVEHEQELCYTLRTVLRGEPRVEGEASPEVCATFLDLLPPASPAGLSVLRTDAGVALAWSPLPEGAEVPAALHVYRATGDGPLERVAELEGGATRWTDPAAPDDSVFEYALTASDARGNESPPSARARLIPR